MVKLINPEARDYPDEFIQTGISAIDHLNIFGSGQNCQYFLAYLLYKELAAQIACQATVLTLMKTSPWSLRPWGLPEEAEFFNDLRRVS